jgi:Ca2+/H+ antiporter
MAASVALVGFIVRDGISRRWEGWFLLTVYLGVAVGFFFAGDR